MASTVNGFPYVETTDAVADYPTTSQALAQEIADRLPIIARGTATVTLSNSGSGYVTVDISAWGFTGQPTFTAISNNYSYYCYRASGGPQTATQMSIGVRHFDDTPASGGISVYWLAVGV